MSVVGSIISFGAILLGQFLEGGRLASLMNFPALLIVFVGTIGAVMLETPRQIFKRAVFLIPWIFNPPVRTVEHFIEKIVRWGAMARKEGILSLESLIEDESNLFMRRGLQLLIDGTEPVVLRRILSLELESRCVLDENAAHVFSSMGGYCPTIGIVGAVLGLIHVMGNLSDPSKLGEGIAVAFVATIYGVSFANLVFFPMGGKLNHLIQSNQRLDEMLIEGLVAISEGENPVVIRAKLEGFHS
jgi:chemotaxis protein MotA